MAPFFVFMEIDGMGEAEQAEQIGGEIGVPLEGRPEDPKDKVDPEKEIEIATGSKENFVLLYDESRVDVYRCKLKNAPAVARAINAVLGALGITTVDGTIGLDLNNPQLIVLAFELCTPELVPAVAELCSLSVEELQELELDDALMVAAKVVEVNQAFFLIRVRRALSALRGSVKENQ